MRKPRSGRREENLKKAADVTAREKNLEMRLP